MNNQPTPAVHGKSTPGHYGPHLSPLSQHEFSSAVSVRERPTLIILSPPPPHLSSDWWIKERLSGSPSKLVYYCPSRVNDECYSFISWAFSGGGMRGWKDCQNRSGKVSSCPSPGQLYGFPIDKRAQIPHPTPRVFCISISVGYDYLATVWVDR
ncbi:hypothetical protein AVEN_101458-1 [Araneus ventricosus]|uniref:Uncharacterized protein n=1 Tax=Araneus ventricosus TaxID=182803 RepID=A0A4Y2RTC4_ARAVE|nr:hypothetical protein AVEN_124617-1 [Araneus ventricosus]GBN78356.1 hypothetical protein AVEN_93257-1 [Araneus ventricosus]GBN78481.1 hypothetical protein AVEN_102893-1 [Araneus ventricosus]GBN78519.1 hypothetical protein AVEN_101458-1 [Araneus ventricosus]